MKILLLILASFLVNVYGIPDISYLCESPAEVQEIFCMQENSILNLVSSKGSTFSAECCDTNEKIYEDEGEVLTGRDDDDHPGEISLWCPDNRIIVNLKLCAMNGQVSFVEIDCRPLKETVKVKYLSLVFNDWDYKDCGESNAVHGIFIASFNNATFVGLKTMKLILE